MHSAKLIPAIAAIGARFVAAQTTTADACETATYTITDLAAATIDCTTMEGDVEVSGDIQGDLAIEGPTRIRGSIQITNATNLNSLSSNSLARIDESFILRGLESLSSINMPLLNDIMTIDWVTLPRLENLRLGEAGISSVQSITISDTSLRNLDDFNVASVSSMNINNNWRLSSYSTQLANVSDSLIFQSNGEQGSGVNITLSNLIWAKTLVFEQVAAVELPSLEYINDSLRFDSNDLASFSAPNLTEIGDGDLAFNGNNGLQNISFPELTSIGGSLTIIDNAGLEVIDGFPKLEKIGGAVKMGGNFTDVELPVLDDAQGGFQLLSTEDIGESCDSFDEKEGREIQGVYRCRGEEEEANDEDSFEDTDGNGGSRNNDDDDSAAGLVSINLFALGAAAAIGIFAQL